MMDHPASAVQPSVPAPVFEAPHLRLYHTDCMVLLRGAADNAFDLAIVDPPYGIGVGEAKYFRREKPRPSWKSLPRDYGDKSWDDEPPGVEYFAELRRVSRFQIIWGANYFIDRLPFASPCWVVWDKDNGGGSFADCELAWTNFNTAVRKFRFRWAGMLQENMAEKETRIHPAQKPVALYRWLLGKYAKAGWRVLDTHLGSGSHAIACHFEGLHLTACEKDADYIQPVIERYKLETAQPEIFAPVRPPEHQLQQEVLL